MILNPQQDEALLRVDQWLKSPDKPWFLLDGAAGTGKTELAKRFINNVEGRAHTATMTGKAASVLHERGLPSATTIHKLIYCPADKSRKHLRDLENYLKTVEAMPDSDYRAKEMASVQHNIAAEKENLKRPGFSKNNESDLRGASLLLVDEYSQVDDQMAEDLLSFEVPILALGDRNQLPPVFGSGFFSKQKPDYTLTEIHRQAKDNPIIRMAQDVLDGKALNYGEYGESAVVRRLEPEQVLAADQILVGRNATRYASNVRVRQLRGIDKTPWPVAGERLVCLRNNHELGLFNGMLYTAVQDALDVGGFINLRVEPLGGGETIFVATHREHYLGRGKEIDIWDRKDAEEFDFAHAMTVHKFQGSQDRKIVLFDEWFSASRREWLYTGLTRAQEWVKVVRS